jgi:hypothetical protein
VKDIRDKAVAMRAYGRQAKNKDMEIDAIEIRIRAERRLGEMIVAQKQTVGLATGGEHGGKKRIDGTRAEPSNARPTLAEAGIDSPHGERDPGGESAAPIENRGRGRRIVPMSRESPASCGAVGRFRPLLQSTFQARFPRSRDRRGLGIAAPAAVERPRGDGDTLIPARIAAGSPPRLR